MRLLDRFREQDFVRTNVIGAERMFRVGAIVEQDGAVWRVTRHRYFNTAPAGTYVVYGVRQRDAQA